MNLGWWILPCITERAIRSTVACPKSFEGQRAMSVNQVPGVGIHDSFYASRPVYLNPPRTRSGVHQARLGTIASASEAEEPQDLRDLALRLGPVLHCASKAAGVVQR